MENFSTNKIVSSRDLIGGELKKVRNDKGITLDNASKHLGIKEEYLKALEDCQYEKLPQGLYGRNFLREYSKFLRIDTGKILEIYDDSQKNEEEERKKDVFSHKVPKARYFMAVPRLIKNFILVVVGLVCLVYLGYYLNNIIAPPNLLAVPLRVDHIRYKAISAPFAIFDRVSNF